MGFRSPTQPPDDYEDYNIARKKVGQRTDVDRARSQETLKRGYARLGGLNTGSYIKQQGILDQEMDQSRNDQQADITAQELAERRRAGQGQVEREFAAAEAEKQRQFQGGQFEKTFGLEKETKLRLLDQTDREFYNDQRTNETNRMTAIHSTGDFRYQKSGLEAMMNDPNTSAGGKAAARLLYINYGYGTPADVESYNKQRASAGLYGNPGGNQ